MLYYISRSYVKVKQESCHDYPAYSTAKMHTLVRKWRRATT